MAGIADALDRLVGRIEGAGKWLGLPVGLLLCAQWPLRDLVRCCSREANDLGQWLFSLFIAIAVTAATRAGTHLRADFFAVGLSPAAQRRVAAAGALVAVLWAVAALFVYSGDALRSLLLFERFPDTNNPGYFIVKLAVVLLAALVAAQGVADLLRALSPGRSP